MFVSYNNNIQYFDLIKVLIFFLRTLLFRRLGSVFVLCYRIHANHLLLLFSFYLFAASFGSNAVFVSIVFRSKHQHENNQ